TGTSFQVSTTDVAVSGSGVTSSMVNVLNSTSLTALLTIDGNAPTGPRDVTVITPFGTSNSKPFTVVQGAPVLTAIDPPSATEDGMVIVTLTGSRFVTDQTTIAFTGTGLTWGTPNVIDPTNVTTSLTISASAPIGSRSVTVSTPYGSSNAL